MRRLWYHGKVDTMVPGEHRQQAVGVENGTNVFVKTAEMAHCVKARVQTAKARNSREKKFQPSTSQL